MSTKPAGEKKLSNAEKQKRYREKNKEILKEAKKGKKQIKVYEGLPTITPEKVKQESKEVKKGDRKMQQITTLMRNHWSSIWKPEKSYK